MKVTGPRTFWPLWTQATQVHVDAALLRLQQCSDDRRAGEAVGHHQQLVGFEGDRTGEPKLPGVKHQALPNSPADPTARLAITALVAAVAALVPLSALAQTGDAPSTAQPASGPSKAHSGWFMVYLSCTHEFVSQRWQQAPWAGRSVGELADTAAIACARSLPRVGSVPMGESAPVDESAIQRARREAKAMNEQSIQRGLTAVREGKDPNAPVEILPPPIPVGRPKLLSCPRPEYPPAAVRAGAKGTTKVRLHVDEAGRVAEVALERASGETREHRLLDRAALEAFKGCNFVPGGTAAWTRFDYVWNLTEDPVPQSSSASAPAR